MTTTSPPWRATVDTHSNMAQWLMAAANQQHNTTLPLPVPSNDSDYGSDIDDATAETLFSQSSATPLPGPPITKAAKIEVKIEEPVIVDEDAVPQDLSMRLARVQHSLDELSANSARIEQLVRSRRRNEAVIEIEYEERNRGAFACKCSYGRQARRC